MSYSFIVVSLLVKIATFKGRPLEA